MLATNSLKCLSIAICCLIAGTFAVTSAASACIDYADYLHWVGSVDTPGNAYGVAMTATHAFVADDFSGLQVIDIGQPGDFIILRMDDPHRTNRGAGIAGYLLVAVEYGEYPIFFLRRLATGCRSRF